MVLKTSAYTIVGAYVSISGWYRAKKKSNFFFFFFFGGERSVQKAACV